MNQNTSHYVGSLNHVTRAWKQARQASVLRQTQVTDAKAWKTFYSTVADSWEDMTGSIQTGRDMVFHMEQHSIVFPGDRVLDLGCGAGRLSLALAERGMRVTALDNNPAMIQKVSHVLNKNKITGVTTYVGDWTAYDPGESHSLSAACFFPEACSPAGLICLERLTTDRCMLALGNSSEAFPLRQAIWEKVMDVPLPAGGFHITFVMDYLGQSGREPTQIELSRPVTLDVTTDCAFDYFRAYFAIFGKTGSDTHQAIADVIATYETDRRIRLEGVSHTVLVFWHIKPDRPLNKGDGS